MTYSDAWSYFSGNTISQDLYKLCVGKKLGEGIGREVYEWLPNSKYVIKVEMQSKSFQNVIEWESWWSVSYTKKIAKWFAPCQFISPCGTILIQHKTTPASKYPKKLPAFLTDFKKTNYGMIGNKFVCHDYGTNSLMEVGKTVRMKNVTWWDN